MSNQTTSQVNEASSIATAILKNVYFQRLEKNPRYSLRAFSKALSVSHTLMSFIFSGKRRLSPDLAEKIADRLDLSFKQRELFFKEFQKNTTEVTPEEKSNNIELDAFSLMSEWQHYAILSLMETKDFKMDFAWIAKRLGTSELLIKNSVYRLKRLDMIEKESKTGKWKQKGGYIRLNNKHSTSATKRFQKQLLHKAIESLAVDPIEKRTHTSITFAMNPKNVAYAVERIRQFKLDLCKELEDMNSKEEVYNITIQLVPVSRRLK